MLAERFRTRLSPSILKERNACLKDKTKGTERNACLNERKGTERLPERTERHPQTVRREPTALNRAFSAELPMGQKVWQDPTGISSMPVVPVESELCLRLGEN
jgi:hypothetical protein